LSGSAVRLNLNVHIHALVVDGVFTDDGAAALSGVSPYA